MGGARLAAEDPLGVARRTARTAPVRLVAGYLLGMAALFVALPTLLDSESPAFLAGTGMTTGTGQILDLGFGLPMFCAAAVLLLRRHAWGYVLAGGLVLYMTIESASFGVDQWLGHLADPTSPAASADIVRVFAVLTIVGAGVTTAFFRGLRIGR